MKKMKLKKMLTMAMAAMMVMTTMSSVSAEIVKPLPGGGEFVIYEEGDELPSAFYLRTASFTFSQTFPKYPSKAVFQTSETINGQSNVLYLEPVHTGIYFNFNTSPSCYVWMYNVTDGIYELEAQNMGDNASKAYSFRNLPYGHTYRFSFAGKSSAVTLSGTCYTG